VLPRRYIPHQDVQRQVDQDSPELKIRQIMTIVRAADAALFLCLKYVNTT
jgi:hypothetical protein